MILLTVDEIISLHHKLINKTGGSGGIRDVGLLESAVYSTETSYDNIEQYQSVEQKAARLMFSLVKIMHLSTETRESAFWPCLSHLNLTGLH